MKQPVRPATGKSRFSGSFFSWRASSHGFTMIELIVVMIIVGILAVAVLPRFASTNAFEAHGQADQVQALLRYAQKEAIAGRRIVYLNLGANPPTFCRKSTCSAACAGDISFPGGSYKTPTTAVTLSSAGGLQLCFDALGQPFDTTDVLAAQRTIAVLDETGATTRNIVIETRTGYVH